MRASACLLLSMICSAQLLAQKADGSVERITLRLLQPPPTFRIDAVERNPPTTIGVFTLVPPATPGEMVRVSVPVGELLSQAVKGAAAAQRRRREAVARRAVEAELEWFKAQQSVSRR